MTPYFLRDGPPTRVRRANNQRGVGGNLDPESRPHTSPRERITYILPKNSAILSSKKKEFTHLPYDRIVYTYSYLPVSSDIRELISLNDAVSFKTRQIGHRMEKKKNMVRVFRLFVLDEPIGRETRGRTIRPRIEIDVCA